MFTFGFDKKYFLIIATTVILTAVMGSLVGLTLGLHEPLPPNGGSPLSPDGGSPQIYSEQFQKGSPRLDEPLPPLGGSPRRYSDESQRDDSVPRMMDEMVDSEYRTYRYAAVTTETQVCSQIGTDILGRQIGSSVDAAIASFLCACVINAHSCGIGGGHFAMIYERPNGMNNKIMQTVTARERAPAAAHRDMFVNTTASSSVGGQAVAVPGEIYGFYQAWQVFGRMPWKDLFTETIRLCEEGFIVEPSLSGAINQYNTSIRNDPNLAELFVKEDGTLIKTGDLLVNAKLGATMRIIADDPMSFYRGQLADDIVADLQEYGSNITKDDLAEYLTSGRSVFKVPLQVPLTNGDYTLFNPPPPSSGVVLSFIMNVLDGYNFTAKDLDDTDNKILTYHRIAEAFKFAYAKRSQLGDEEFVNITELLFNLTSPAYGDSIRAQIDDTRTHDVEYYGPTFDIIENTGTAHINVLAPDGAAVALTGTVNLYFGAKVRGRRTGIIFNDEMDDFSTPGTVNEFGVPASPSNYIEPGKIPMSSMSPTLVQHRDGRVVFQSGAAGGTRITTATSFVAMNSLWFELDLLKACDTARLHHQLLPNELVYETTLEPEIVFGLRAKNHTMVTSTGIAVVGSVHSECPLVHATGAQSEEKGNEALYCIEAVCDRRKGGVPDGY